VTVRTRSREPPQQCAAPCCPFLSRSTHCPSHTRKAHPMTATVDPPSRYRCREHPEQPVTFRGKGCPRCTPITHRSQRLTPTGVDDRADTTKENNE
jgi:hypothetical protein